MMSDNLSPDSSTAGAAPGERVQAALTAFASASLAPNDRRRVITAPLNDIAGEAKADHAGIYGALHALAPALDALHTDDDLRSAIASRTDRHRACGQQLLDLHSSDILPWPTVRVDMDAIGAGIRGGVPRLMLRPMKEYGVIRIDALTTICNVPPAIWEHTIGEGALMDLEFALWRTQSNASGPDVSVDKAALVSRISWLCRASVETLRVLNTAAG